MSEDNVPLHTDKVRRRSIFEDHLNTEKANNSINSKLNFPELKTEIYYPIEYVEKVRTEIEKWKMHITKILEQKNKFKVEKNKLQSMTVDENILSLQQIDVLNSFNNDEYMRRAKNFCDRAAIIAHKIQYKSETELEKRYLFVQRKLEKQIKNEHFSENSLRLE